MAVPVADVHAESGIRRSTGTYLTTALTVVVCVMMICYAFTHAGETNANAKQIRYLSAGLEAAGKIYDEHVKEIDQLKTELAKCQARSGVVIDGVWCQLALDRCSALLVNEKHTCDFVAQAYPIDPKQAHVFVPE